MDINLIKKELTDLSLIKKKVEREEYLEKISQDTLKVLIFLLDTDIVTKIAATTFQKDVSHLAEGKIETFDDFFKFLFNITGKNVEVAEIQHYAKSIDELDFIEKLTIKKFPLGFSADTLNKVHKDSIFVHSVQLADKFEEKYHTLTNRNVTITEKLDGIRITAFKNDSNVTFLTRNGNEQMLPEIKETFITHKLPNGIYDGEVIASVSKLPLYENKEQEHMYDNVITVGVKHLIAKGDLNKALIKLFKDELNDKTVKSVEMEYDYFGIGYMNVEAFNKEKVLLGSATVSVHDDRTVYSETSKIMSKKGDKTSVEYHVFDYLKDKNDKSIYKERKKTINNILKDFDNKLNIKEVNTLLIDEPFDFDLINQLHNVAIKNNWEGLMVNTSDGEYKFSRTSELLKVKQFNTVDLRIIDVEYAISGKHKGLIGSLVVKYKGNKVNVGSGLTDEIRQMDKKDLIGRIIEVQYFEETKNQEDNKISIRFPSFKHFRDDKTEESYY